MLREKENKKLTNLWLLFAPNFSFDDINIYMFAILNKSKNDHEREEQEKYSLVMKTRTETQFGEDQGAVSLKIERFAVDGVGNEEGSLSIRRWRGSLSIKR